jgi:hypothetical protein
MLQDIPSPLPLLDLLNSIERKGLPEALLDGEL